MNDNDEVENYIDIDYFGVINEQMICHALYLIHFFHNNLISEILLENDISGIIISNTSESSREVLKDIQKHQKGGLSGKPIEKKSNILINKFYNLFKGKIKIIGVGGIDSGQSAYEKFLLGADYLQLYTGMVFQGPNIAGSIKKELKELLIRDGVKNFTEIIGNKTLS